MCHNFLTDGNFFRHLFELDKLIAQQVQQQGCPYCGSVLHSARYRRKPRGVNRHLLGPDYEYRLSFCCASEGCRRRSTPGSVRFLGRRVYLGVVVVLMTVLASGVDRKRAQYLSEQIGIGERTLHAWRQWWRKAFVGSVFWYQAKGRLMPPVNESHLPGELLARFNGKRLAERLSQLLLFIAPVSTRAGIVTAMHTD